MLGPAIVWVVEDDDLFREAVAAILSDAPDVASVETFASVEAALEALDAGGAPDVVLTDIQLPGLSGIEGIRAFRDRAAAAHLVVLTVYEDDARIVEAICAGAGGYLLKPSSAEAIAEAVRAARRGGAPITPRIAARVLDVFARLARPTPDDDAYGLTAREREVLQRLVDGETKGEVADRLFLSPHTVDVHVRNIYGKLQVHSRSGAVAKALREGLAR
ncbi:MAG: response regulator transcription factor [Rubricoccaceae bacterium]